MENIKRPTKRQLDLINKYASLVNTGMKILTEVPDCREIFNAFDRLRESQSWFTDAVFNNIDKNVKEEDKPVIQVNI